MNSQDLDDIAWGNNLLKTQIGKNALIFGTEGYSYLKNNGNFDDLALYFPKEDFTIYKLTSISTYDTTTYIVMGASDTNYLLSIYSLDSGETWTEVNLGLTNIVVNGIAHFSALKAIAVGEYLIYKTTDGGVNWTNITSTNFPSKIYRTVTILNGDCYIIGKSTYNI